MRTFGKVVLCLGALAILASPALAQQRGFGGMVGGGGAAMLLNNKSVQKELKLDDGQVSKIESYAAEVMEKMQGLREKIQDVPQEERREKMQALMKPIQDD